jgi:hypothetical protein
VATSEFQFKNPSTSALKNMDGDLDATVMDWGGALGKLRERVGDMDTGKSAETPNQVIVNLSPPSIQKIVQAMSGAVSSLLGGHHRQG